MHDLTAIRQLSLTKIDHKRFNYGVEETSKRPDIYLMTSK